MEERTCDLRTPDKARFEVPLYTVADAARIVAVPASTLAAWAKGYVRRSLVRPDVTGDPIVTWLPSARPQEPSIPFVGPAEALVLAAVRRSGVAAQLGGELDAAVAVDNGVERMRQRLDQLAGAHGPPGRVRA